MPKIRFSFIAFFISTEKRSPYNKNIPIQLLPNEHFDTLYRFIKDIEQYQFSKDIHSFIALSSFYGVCGQLLQSVVSLPPRQINKTIIPAIQYIEHNYSEQISVEFLATLCFISTSRFYALFKEQTGLPPIVYKNKVAIQHAAQELLYNKEESITNIAERHGFSSLIYFERLFKKLIGKSPSLYRKKNTLL